MPRIQWIGQSATPKESKVDSLRLLNGYAEIVESKQGKTAIALYGTPGLKLFTTLPGSGAVRGLFLASNGHCYGVRGNTLYDIRVDGTTSALGTLLTSIGPVVMDDNGIALVLVDGAYGYAVTLLTGAFTRITDDAFVGADRVAFLENRLVVNKPNTQQYQWTDLVTTTIEGLNFSSADGSPDLLKSLFAHHRELWLPGLKSTEVHYSTGDANLPFSRIQSVFIPQGIVAPHSITKIGDVLCWLSANDEGQGMVVQTSGYAVQPISTHPVAEAIQGYDTISDALGWSQQHEGHLFYWLTFPTANHTWIYDVASGLWHERGWLDPATGTVGRHRANCYAYAFQKHLVGDYQDGRVYELDGQTYTDDGDEMLFEATLPPLGDPDNYYRVRQDYLQIDCVSGIGLDGAPSVGTDPQMMLLISNDGGATYPIERAASMGRIGQPTTQVAWWQLGSAYDRRCKIRISDPVKRAILSASTITQLLGR